MDGGGDDLLSRFEESDGGVFFELMRDELCDDFGVCLGVEDDSFRLEIHLEFEVVVDRTVVAEHNSGVLIEVRVRVLICLTPACRPSCVPDSDETALVFGWDNLLQRFNAVDFLH